MRTAISIGARVVPVDIDQSDTGYTASCIQRVSGEERRFTGSADTYDHALQALKLKVLSALRL
ncbi:MAG TPA: hypothetical protein VFO41_08690 [Alphaproteobacteria bacterium]|nr:hypothetical protein [Alphaproteobacteria bacterium]